MPLSTCCEQAVPRSRGGLAVGSGAIDVLRADPEDGGEGPPGVAEDGGPEVGDPLTGLARASGAAARSQGIGGHPDVAAHTGHEGSQGNAAAGDRVLLRHGATERLDEGAAAEDPLIPEVGLPTPAELHHRVPAAEAAKEAAALEIGPPALGDAIGDEHPVRDPGPVSRSRELAQDGRGVLPGAGHPIEQRAVARPGIPIEMTEVGHHLRAERVQVEVADEFQEVGFFLDYDGLVPILKEMPHTMMPAVEGARVPGEETPHAPGQRALPGAHEEMGVIGEERPRVDSPGAGLDQAGHAGDEVRAVRIIPEDAAPLEPPHHHVMQRLRGIQPGSTGHGDGSLPQRVQRGNVPKEWFMPLFWVLVIAGVIALVLRNAGGHEGEVSRELAALRRDIQDLKDEVRKLREEHKASSSTGG